jgi:AraC family transcriptional regulator, regulatory protein of adaptative response / methylated-DNA-[protein]-cysteine methyltransferase
MNLFLPTQTGVSSQGYLEDAARWQAVLERNARADGEFLYAVRIPEAKKQARAQATGIYCRPSCPSRRPDPRNVVFYSTPADAEAAGYRACKRCRPDEVHPQQQVIAKVKHLLDTIEPKPTLEGLAKSVGMSPYHLQRIFKRVTGLSPKQYVKASRAARLEKNLKAGKAVTAALYDAGYGSSQALYSEAGVSLGMTPRRFSKGGEGTSMVYGCFDSPLGRMLIAATERGVAALRFGDDRILLEELKREFPGAVLTEDTAGVEPYAEAVNSYLAGEGRSLQLPLDLAATEFQQRVWEALQRIPFGETRSYREIAEMIGQPHAVRAVARACAANPVALAIPCHRVVRTGGRLGGYRWGVQRKRALLEQEEEL